MLKQTVESSDRNRILHLGGDQYSYVDLGTTYDISHRHKLPQKIKFSFEWTPKNVPDHTISMVTEVMVMENKQIGFTPNRYTSSLKFESEINIEDDQVNLEYFKYSFKASDNQWNHIAINSQPNNDNEMIYKLSIDGDFLRHWLSLESPSIQKARYTFNHNQLVNNFNVQYVPLMLSSRNTNLANLALSYLKLFKNTYYLAPLREYPKKIYLWSGENPQDIGKQGASAFSALLSSNKKHPQVQTAVAKALKDLGLIDSFRLNVLAENRGYYEVLVKRSPNSAEVLITDVGFGVSQVFPILVLCYYAPKGATLIFEQPEIHLHPSVQAGLADIFIEVIKTRNIQIIIESHSEHLLRRLQRRMAEEKDGFTNDDAALYFCKMNDQGDSELVTLDIDDYGNICNYPEGFFGDEMGDLVAMTEAAINRQMNVGA